MYSHMGEEHKELSKSGAINEEQDWLEYLQLH